MNEYRGFKVGDKVEITFSAAYPTKGTITSFGDRRIGGCAHPDTMDVWVNKTAKFDIIYLVSHGLIKKLPKYAVGDVVRDKHDGKIYEVTMVLGSETYRSGDVCFLEGSVEPFDGFRVDDTVWTLKRGKGKIVGFNADGGWSKTRDFFVRFECLAKDVTPKTSNLIPTEAKYKYLVEASKKPLVPSAEAWAKVADAFGKSLIAIEVAANLKKFSDACKKFSSGGVVFSGGTGIDGRYCEPSLSKKPTYTRTAHGHLEIVDEEGCQKGYRASKFAVGELVSYAGCIRAVVDAIHWKDGKFTYDLRTNYCLRGLPEDSLIAVPQPKFKVGDVVFYHSLASSNKKWVFLESKYGVARIRQIDDNGKERICYPNESDLRLWKETEIKWVVGYMGMHQPLVCAKENIKLSDFTKVIHLGRSTEGMDAFCGISKIGVPIVFYGIKGDDIS